MSVPSLDASKDSKVDSATLAETCRKLGITIRDEEQADYTRLLAVFDDTCRELMDMPDYVPPVDLDRFPRKNVRTPTAEENTYGAWAVKCSIRDTRPNDGLLAGKRVTVKDMISVKDVPMRMGTEFVNGFVPNTDATVVTRVLEAGGEIIGKTVCENLCHTGISDSAASGPVDNPHIKGYSAGGSSSGSGVVVSLGECDMSIGADQGGSVRIPSCNCGIVGLKPTHGLIPYTGAASNEPTHDHLGPMTKTVLDNALLLQVLAGGDNIDDRSLLVPPAGLLPKYYDNLKAKTNPQSVRGMKLGIIKESLEVPRLDPRVKATFLKAVDGLRQAGAEIEEISIPLHKKGPMIWTALARISGYQSRVYGPPGRRGHVLNEMNLLFLDALKSQSSWDKAYVATTNTYLNGAYGESAYPAVLGKATNLGRQLRDSYDKALQQYDALLTPTLPFLATSHSNHGDGPLKLLEKQVGLTSNTCPFNLTGHPVLTLPIGLLEPQEGPAVGTGGMLPVGMQIVGTWWGEETVYIVAHGWELSNDWKHN